MLSNNKQIIQERWPQLLEVILKSDLSQLHVEISDTEEPTLIIDNIHISSGYNQSAEAILQTERIPSSSKEVWVYGLATGMLPFVLLQRETIQKLYLVILNPAIALLSFTHFDHSDWLNDSRVELRLGRDENGKLHSPMAVCPAELQLADDESARLRDKIFLELVSPYMNRRHSKDNREIIVQIERNIEYISQDGDVQSLFNSQIGNSIIIAAAGPSLDQNLSKMVAEREAHFIIAVNSALKPLLAASIIPDLVVVIDDDPKIVVPFQSLDGELLKKIPLIYFPRIPSEILSLWCGPRLTAYSKYSSYDKVRKQYPKANLFASGSVLHTATDLAVKMGAKQIIFVGADLAFPNGKLYAKNSGWGDEEIGAAQHWVLDGHGNRIPTRASFRGYLRDLEDYIEQASAEIEFLNSSKDGAEIVGASLWE